MSAARDKLQGLKVTKDSSSHWSQSGVYEGHNYWGAELVMYVFSVHGSYDNRIYCALPDHMRSTLITVEPKLVVDTSLCSKFIIFDLCTHISVQGNAWLVLNFSLLVYFGVFTGIEGNIGCQILGAPQSDYWGAAAPPPPPPPPALTSLEVSNLLRT